jgi:outer membrane protein assembly factor BamB
MAVVLAWGLVAAAAWGADAGRIARLSGRNKGILALPRVRAAAELIAPAEAGFLVCGVCADPASYQEISRAVAEKGLLARRVYLELSPEPVPGLAERLADVLFTDGLTAADLTPERKEQWLRILSPHRGKLVAGGPGIDAPRLTAWLGRDARIVKDGDLTFAILTRPPQPGAGQWRHRHHAPDNRRVSGDRLLGPQLLTQWYSLPLNEGFWGTSVVAAGGRAYILNANRHGHEDTDLSARSLHNGCELWRLRRKGGNEDLIPVYGGRSVLAAADDGLWLGAGADLVLLDGETGREVKRIAGPVAGGQIKWLVLAGEGRLLALAGPKDEYHKLRHQAFVKNPFGTRVAMYRTDGTKIWEKPCGGSVDEREIALAGGRLYFHVQGAGTVALSADSGDELWRNVEACAAVDEVDTKKQIGQLLVSDRSLMADEHAVVIGASWKTNVVALDPEDGRLLWKRPTGRVSRSLTAILKDGRWYGNAILDARTGEVAMPGRIPQSICSVNTSVGGWLMTAFGDMYTLENLRQPVRYADIRVPCDIGNIVADGVLLGVASQCTCHADIHGFRVAGVSDIDPHQPGPAGNRLDVFTDKAVPDLAMTAADWPTHRHDPARTGATPAKAGAKPAELWRIDPGPLAESPAGFTARILPSPAVTAAGLALWVDRQGRLRCLDVATGEEKWRRHLGARSLAPPAIDGPRVFVGDTAGYVHAFAARDGTPLWRFRAAPHRRRILWYGQLFSTWPCTGGVLVRDGVLFSVAAFQETNGTHAYALDPATGKVKWESHDAGSGGEWKADGAFGLFGNLAAGHGRLWLASGTFYPGSYSLADGSWIAAPSQLDHHFYGNAMRRGVDIGVLDRFVITGGMRLSQKQEPGEHMIKGDGYNALSVTPPTVPKRYKDKSFYGVDMLNNSNVTPAWDETLFVATRSKRGTPVAWRREGVVAELAAEFDRGMDPKDRGRHQVRSLNSEDSKKTLSSPADPVWELPEIFANELVLCADAALATHAGYKAQIPRWGAMPPASSWHLSALERQDGKERWRVDLPSKPMRGGLAVDRDGRILVMFDDGSVGCYGAK